MIEAEWTLLPGLGISGLVAIGVSMMAFGVMKNRTDEIPKWRDSVSLELKEIREEQNEKFERMEEKQERHHAENRAGIDKLRESVASMAASIGFLKEERERTRDRGRDRDR